MVAGLARAPPAASGRRPARAGRAGPLRGLHSTHPSLGGPAGALPGVTRGARLCAAVQGKGRVPRAVVAEGSPKVKKCLRVREPVPTVLVHSRQSLFPPVLVHSPCQKNASPASPCSRVCPRSRGRRSPDRISATVLQLCFCRALKSNGLSAPHSIFGPKSSHII